jgi:2-polyprenyl-6-methoxyphenol hydroxylase-like FAD-dependent oxidoreductase
LQRPSIGIIGAGIGGLSFAIALQQMGFTPHIYEQAAALRPIGAGIILGNNAMQVYKKLGLDEELCARAERLSYMAVTREDLAILAKTDLDYFHQQNNVPSLALERSELHRILLQHIDRRALRLDHRLVNIQNTTDDVRLTFANGWCFRHDLVIAADGQSSHVRKQLFPESQLRSTSQLCWRSLTDLSLQENLRHGLREAWAWGTRFGFVPLSPTRVYWYALQSTVQRYQREPDALLPNLFYKYASPIPELIRNTNRQTVHAEEIRELKPLKNWAKDRVCLLGDAAHSTTPNLGQGAGQAIEDALVLAQCLDKYAYQAAFGRYQELRQRKVRWIARSSRRLGRIAHWMHPAAVAFRNRLSATTPGWLKRRQTARIFRLAEV